MAANGKRPWKQAKASTAFLRVPVRDWPAVKRGLKTEFRASSTPDHTLPWNIVCPSPVIAFAVGSGPNSSFGREAQLMVCEKAWFEPLGAISEESLAREGFKSLAEFRRYWMSREKKRFSPMRKVICYRIRPWDDARDSRFFADLLLGRLYGEFLPGYVAEDAA